MLVLLNNQTMIGQFIIPDLLIRYNISKKSIIIFMKMYYLIGYTLLLFIFYKWFTILPLLGGALLLFGFFLLRIKYLKKYLGS